MGFVIGFEGAEFALEGAFSIAFVAQHEILHFDFVGGQREWMTAADRNHEVVVLALDAEAEPFGLSGAKDEIGFERFGVGLIDVFPAGFEDFPTELGFGGQDESGGACAVLAGVLGGFRFSFGRGGACATGVTLFGFGIRRIRVIVDGRRGGRGEERFVRKHHF